MRQVDRDVVDAARGMGMTEPQIVRRVELPLALPSIFGGIRTVRRSTSWPPRRIGRVAGVDTLGDADHLRQRLRRGGQLGAAILVAILTLTADAGSPAVQRAVTPRG